MVGQVRVIQVMVDRHADLVRRLEQLEDMKRSAGGLDTIARDPRLSAVEIGSVQGGLQLVMLEIAPRPLRDVDLTTRWPVSRFTQQPDGRPGAGAARQAGSNFEIAVVGQSSRTGHDPGGRRSFSARTIGVSDDRADMQPPVLDEEVSVLACIDLPLAVAPAGELWAAITGFVQPVDPIKVRNRPKCLPPTEDVPLGRLSGRGRRDQDACEAKPNG